MNKVVFDCASLEDVRDTILHGRGPLEGDVLNADQTNAVLSVIDEALEKSTRERSIDSIAENTITRIVDDLCDRSGLQNVWEGIDRDIQNEIIAIWRQIVVDEIRKG